MLEQDCTEEERRIMIANKEFERFYLHEIKEQLLWDLKYRTGAVIPEPCKSRGIYFVYGVWVDDDLVYVGQGKGDRWKHPTSGISHNKELNKIFFAGEKMTVSFFRQDIPQQDAVKLESCLIAFYNPRANKAGKTKMPMIYSDFESPYECTFDMH